jgi:lipopolysaccharide biosynthesis regulator YciM
VWGSLSKWFFEPVNQQLLLGLIIALGIGFIIGRWMHRAKSNKDASTAGKVDKAFFKGFRYILSNDRDQAIEEFTKSVQVNSDTVETYVALGNLYRSRGDIDRAIRIRQSVILRPNIDDQIKTRALFDLGLDYRKGGFLNRALKALLEVSKRTPSDVEALKAIESIYAELKDWEKAYGTRQKIARLATGDHQNILAHYLVENAKVHQEKENMAKSISLYNKAISTHRSCVDAYLHLGDLYFERQEYKKAVSTWKKVVRVAPRFTFLAYRRLEGAYSKMKNLKPVEDFLRECAQSDADAFTHMALARYLYNENDIEGALREIENTLELEPSFWEARKLKGRILISQGREKEVVEEYKEFIEHLDVPHLKFQCSQCGYKSDELQWQCPQCKKWDTIHLIDSAGVQSNPPA